MDKYTRGKVLGKGSFGKASVVERKSDKVKFVMKEIDISKMPKVEKDASLQEAKLLQALRHPNIVSCNESFLERGTLCIIMDYCDAGDLYQALQKRRGVLLPEEQILDWTVQLCLGLKHVHDRKILHRDLKSQNVFMSNGGLLKLGDFGVSKVLNSTHHLASTAVGTPYYLSPEICQNKKYNQKSDIWSLGCLLYEITSLKHAFEAGSLKLLIHKIIRGQYPPLSSRYSQELRNLIDKMITKDPAKRPNINQILAEPIIKNRIHNFLSATLRQEEFSHTIIHARRKPGELVPGQGSKPRPSSGEGNIRRPSDRNMGAMVPQRPGLPSQAPPGASRAANVAVVSSSAARQAPRPGVPMQVPSSDQRRIQNSQAVQEQRRKEAAEREAAAKKQREEHAQAQRQQREAENKRLEEERQRLVADRQRFEAERKAADERRRAAAEADRVRRANEAEARRQAEADRLKARADELKRRQEAERAAVQAEKERKETERKQEKERQDMVRKEFIMRQREAMRNRNQVEVDVRVPGRPPSARPQWQDVTIPDVQADVSRIDPIGGHGRVAARAPSSTELSDAERRRVWEENQAAARRNRAQLEDGPPAAPQRRRSPEDEPVAAARRAPSRPSRREWDDRPDLAHLPVSERRRLRQEEERRAREAELQDFQRRNWQEMKAAAERNRRQLMGLEAGAGSGGAQAAYTVEEPEGQTMVAPASYTVADADVEEHAAMVQDMARVYNDSEEFGDEAFQVEYEDDEFEEEEDESSKEELRKSLSRFMLNGREIDLGIDAGSSLPARVEALRIYLEDHIGFDAFVKVYQLMEGVSQDDDENQIMEEIFRTLGVEKMPYLQLIHQLIICEESMHSGKV